MRFRNLTAQPPGKCRPGLYVLIASPFHRILVVPIYGPCISMVLPRFARLSAQRFVPLLFFLSSALSQQVLGSASAPRPSGAKCASDRIPVKFRHGLSANSKANVHRSVGTQILRQYKAVRDLEAVGLPANLDVKAALRSYRQRPEIEYAEPDYTVHLTTTPNDTLFPQCGIL